jgi:hypothetical protein
MEKLQEACEVPRENPTPEEIKDILRRHRVVAVVGLSADPGRDSYRVAQFLMQQGFEVIPVNPNHPEILGKKSYPGLLDIPSEIGVEIVDIFRKPDAVPQIVDEAIQIGAKVIWMQEGIVHNAAADKARAAGLKVVMSRCMMKEYSALILQEGEMRV